MCLVARGGGLDPSPCRNHQTLLEPRSAPLHHEHHDTRGEHRMSADEISALGMDRWHSLRRSLKGLRWERNRYSPIVVPVSPPNLCYRHWYAKPNSSLYDTLSTSHTPWIEEHHDWLRIKRAKGPCRSQKYPLSDRSVLHQLWKTHRLRGRWNRWITCGFWSPI